MSSLRARIGYLGIADFDYLSARLLLLHGFVSTGLPKAAEAFEKLIKLFLILEAKITRNEELTTRNLKEYGHDLITLFGALKTKVPATFPPEWDEYLKLLQESYDRRYPEHWRQVQIEVSVHELDSAYTYLRNNVIQNFPPEEADRARHFGTFIYDAYTPQLREVVERLGGKPPDQVLRQSNQSFESLDIEPSRL